MKISINDVAVQLTDGATVQDALDAKEINPQGIATALNGTVIPAGSRASKTLREGDKIVIIKAFYGG
ncbi:MAG: sulfur carrier protein ThiS [Duncaniella sp.]|nr:sulfur carrier protein ThiS [Duncaniella sp.]